MNRTVLQANLNRLLAQVRGALAHAKGSSASFPTNQATLFSEGLFLAHSCRREVFPKICASRKLLSQEQAARAGNGAVKPGTAETALGTTDMVFLYVGSFRYPATACGLLFRPSLERHRQNDGCASPFDSGGLVRHLVLPDPAEGLVSFHQRHEVSIPDHRKLLALTLDLCFADPYEYMNAKDADRLPASPYGLRGGDLRRYTHEVRLPQSVDLDAESLEAAFVAGALGEDPAVEAFAEWCLEQGVHYKRFQHPGSGEFDALRQEAIGYIMQKL